MVLILVTDSNEQRDQEIRAIDPSSDEGSDADSILSKSEIEGEKSVESTFEEISEALQKGRLAGTAKEIFKLWLECRTRNCRIKRH